MRGYFASHLVRVAVLLLVLTGISAAGLIAFGAAAPPPRLDEPGRAAALGGFSEAELPPPTQYSARNGSPIHVRVYPTQGAKTSVILVHGATGSSRAMHALARHLSSWGAARVYSLDVRGHGMTGPRGDLEYAGQLDVDMAELIGAVRREQPGDKLLMVAHGLGTAFVVRYAGENPKSPRPQADGYLLLAPLLEKDAPIDRAGSEPVWGRLSVARAVGLAAIGNIGLKLFHDLPVQHWTIGQDDAEGDRTSTYSFRLWKQFRASEDYRRDLKGVKPRLAVMVGTRDEYLVAENFGPAIRYGKPDAEIIALEGVTHYGILSQPQALDAIAAWVRR